MKYSVAIVDDEPNIVAGLKFLVERHLPECAVAGVAHDGEEGARVALETKAEIVITDIRMPAADGIEMIRRLKSAGSAAKFIIISGYADFSYAKRAITLGVEEYITKPVEEDELCRAMRRVCAAILKNREAQLRTERLEETLGSYAQNFRDFEMKAFLDSTDIDLGEMSERAKRIGFPPQAFGYGCAAIEFAHEGGGESEKSAENGESVNGGQKGVAARVVELVMSAAQREFCDKNGAAAPEPGSGRRGVWAFPSQKNLAIAVVAIPNARGAKGWRAFWARMAHKLAEDLQLAVCVGISELHKSPHQAREAFSEAQYALNYKVIKGSSRIIGFGDVKRLKGVGLSVSPENIRRLEDSMDNMDDEGCKLAVCDIFRSLEREKELSLTDLQLISLDLILVGIRKMPYLQMRLNDYLGKNILSLDSISKFETIEQLRNWIVNILRSMNELMLKERVPEQKDAVGLAKKYMEENFHKNISLNELAARYFLNPYYFSQLFKKKTGQTYQSYLMGLRVRRAKTLLERTELKLSEVCGLVGYRDVEHFSKIFERLAGMKPAECRKRAPGR